MLAVALLLLVLPLLKNHALARVDGTQRNADIARQRHAELKQQLRDGLLSQTQYDEQYLELQQSLNDDLDTDPGQRPQTGNGRWAIPVIVLFLPLLSLLLYFHLADPEALQKAEIQQANDKTVTEVRTMIARIIERLKQNPDDIEGWLMLGRSYKYLQQYPDAAKVFAKLYQIQPDNPEVLLNYAESLAMVRNGQLAGEPAALAYKAVKLAPDNNDALWMAGMAKAEEGEAEQAIAYWQKLAGQLPAGSASQQQVQQMITEAAARQSETTGSVATNIGVRVEIDAALKPQVQAGQTVFIYAQALNGPKMPLAIVRKLVADLPVSVNLNDTMAMQPNLHLADFKQLKIVARISKTGDASTQTGDFIGASELSLPANDQPVSVLINQEVK